jgi:hypothetical protein
VNITGGYARLWSKAGQQSEWREFEVLLVLDCPPEELSLVSVTGEIWKSNLEMEESGYVIASLNFRTPLSITLLLFFVWKNF